MTAPTLRPLPSGSRPGGELEFALGALTYLRRVGLPQEEILRALVEEVGLPEGDARRLLASRS